MMLVNTACLMVILGLQPTYQYHIDKINCKRSQFLFHKDHFLFLELIIALQGEVIHSCFE